MTTPRSANDPYASVPKLGELRDNVLFGDVWERKEMGKRDRSIITVAVLIATYRTEELKGHMGRALDNGVSVQELREIVLHVTFYGGWPTGVNAARVLKEVLDARGLS
jgi:4-carboxymuconolactone decarboxylase